MQIFIVVNNQGNLIEGVFDTKSEALSAIDFYNKDYQWAVDGQFSVIERTLNQRAFDETPESFN